MRRRGTARAAGMAALRESTCHAAPSLELRRFALQHLALQTAPHEGRRRTAGTLWDNWYAQLEAEPLQQTAACCTPPHMPFAWTALRHPCACTFWAACDESVLCIPGAAQARRRAPHLLFPAPAWPQLPQPLHASAPSPASTSVSGRPLASLLPLWFSHRSAQVSRGDPQVPALTKWGRLRCKPTSSGHCLLWSHRQ